MKDAYFAESQKLSELERKQAEMDGNLGNDFGPDDVFLTLTDRSGQQANLVSYSAKCCCLQCPEFGGIKVQHWAQNNYQGNEDFKRVLSDK